MYDIEFTEEAVGDLSALRKFDQARVVAAIEEKLINEPTTITRNRKILRPNKLAEWALRVDVFRIYYDAQSAERRVKVIAIGEKVGSDVYIRGKKYEL